ncbi:unnamed protein product [Fraxinus pennsylvanica]|uniref:Uncharacterized protein n=1 Tax=Fraxinus pennsylvanica TaxID=56036 RepID=A0AAD2E765_9LAMI|nr:unnamed protein product [Fraxinus pennsylvanica]
MGVGLSSSIPQELQMFAVHCVMQLLLFHHLVRPCPTDLYFLCNLDQNIAVTVRTVYGFKSEEESNQNGVEIIKDALSRVLVHFYPLVGRLTISSDKKLAVDCTVGGAVFAAAEADCKLEDLGDITKPHNGMLCQLVYDIPGAENILEIPPMVAQVSCFL